MNGLSRRRFLVGAAGLGALGLAPPFARTAIGATDAAATILTAVSRTIEVNGKPAAVYGLLQPNGRPGLVTEAGKAFRVHLTNDLPVETLIHWHGLTPPPEQDGVPELSQPPLPTAETYAYEFPLRRAGTNWMHSHVGLQAQQLLAAPLIVRDPGEAALDEQEVVVLFHDFIFRDPEEVLADLRMGRVHGMGAAEQEGGGASMSGMDHGAMGAGAGVMTMDETAPMEMDLNDVELDAYLANDRMLADPEIVRVEPGGRVRLRIINGAAATNFVLDLDALEGKLIAVDGDPILPLRGKRFELAIAQRLDIRLRLPSGQGAYPVLAQREGEEERTGIVLATRGARIERVAERAGAPAAPVGLGLERRLRAAQPLAARPADRRHLLALTGSMAGYVWSLNSRSFKDFEPLPVVAGERVEIVMPNRTQMSHPMHLHGHHFQVVEIDGERLAGAMRDTVLVPPRSTVTVAFDADNPGRWAFHCHHLYHMAAGMMGAIAYAE